MLTKTFVAAGALLSMATAVPMQQKKRDIVWHTEIEMDYVTVDVTTTIWLQPGETPPTVASPAGESPAPNAHAPGHYGHKHHGHHTQSPPESPAAPPPPPETPTTYAAPTSAAAPETPSSPYVAPTPTPTTTEAAAPPPPAYTPPASPTPSPSSAPQPSSPPSGGSPSGETYTGDMTYYAPGLGSCGITSTDSEDVVALPVGMMTAHNGANPNDNDLCGKTITISYGGKTATATVVDTCPGCMGDSIDLSPPVFAELADMSEGRVSGVKWWFS